jgi:hypothetical protein
MAEYFERLSVWIGKTRGMGLARLRNSRKLPVNKIIKEYVLFKIDQLLEANEVDVPLEEYNDLVMTLRCPNGHLFKSSSAKLARCPDCRVRFRTYPKSRPVGNTVIEFLKGDLNLLRKKNGLGPIIVT